jgi:hypothetical protein
MWSTIKQTIHYDTDVKLYKGRDYILEEMEGLNLALMPNHSTNQL